MTVEEFRKKLLEAFNYADTNKNNSLEIDEARNLSKQIHQHMGTEFNEEKFKANFEAADKNANGKLEFDEFFAKSLAAAQEKGLVAKE